MDCMKVDIDTLQSYFDTDIVRLQEMAKKTKVKAELVKEKTLKVLQDTQEMMEKFVRQ